jgi:hypothetical protein
MERQSGSHPDTTTANSIVLASCSNEFPAATLSDVIGTLYPLPSQRTIFVSRVVQNTATAGFRITADKVPVGDADTLNAVSAAMVANAVA